MEDKQIKNIKRYLEAVTDGGDDLVQNINKLITTASLQGQALVNTQVSLLQKEALLKYLTKIVSFFFELNHSVLTFLDSERPPITTENVQIISKELSQPQQSSVIQDLHDYFKADLNECGSMFDFSTNGPKISNNQVVNDSYIRKPLDNTTLKAICSNFINSNLPDTESISVKRETNQVMVDTSASIEANNAVDATATVSIKQERVDVNNAQIDHISPTFSSLGESEVFSTVSSVAYQHPLTNLRPPKEIPKEYDSQDLKQIKENLIYLSKKMGFDSQRFDEMKNRFDKNLPASNFEYEEPVKEVQEVKEEVLIAEVDRIEEPCSTINNSTGEMPTVETNASDHSDDKIPQKHNNNLDISDNPTIVSTNTTSGIDEGPSESTGAVRKQKMPVEDLIEFSSSISDSECCEKVNTWLNNNTVAQNKLVDSSEAPEKSNAQQNSAVEKLHNVKRYDRNEEAREEARKDMPDLRLVPVEVPKVIKNDLNSDSNSSSRKNGEKKEKLKDINKENGVYDIKKMKWPSVGTACIFSHIVSPSEFHIQSVNETTTQYLDEITEKLNTRFRKTVPVFKNKTEAFERLGKFCFGYLLGTREAWYRLQILDWELGCPSPQVEVKSIDYGFRCKTSYTYLREMTKDLADIPMLAIQCHFPLLSPPGSTYANVLSEWPLITIESLYDMANFHNDNNYLDDKLFELILAESDGDSLAVDLVPYGEQDADSLRNLLLDASLAVDMIEDYGDHPELGEFFEDIAELEQHENLNELVLGYDAKDEMRICRFTRNDGTCYKGKNCKLEHITLKGRPTNKNGCKKKRKTNFRPFFYPG